METTTETTEQTVPINRANIAAELIYSGYGQLLSQLTSGGITIGYETSPGAPANMVDLDKYLTQQSRGFTPQQWKEMRARTETGRVKMVNIMGQHMRIRSVTQLRNDVPEAHNTTHDEVLNAARHWNLKIISPGYAQPVTRPLDEVEIEKWGKQNVDRGFIYNGMIDNTIIPWRKPSYNPIYERGQYDSTLYDTLQVVKAYAKVHKDVKLEESMTTTEKMYNLVTANYYFGNGSPEGQLGRFSLVLKARQDAHGDWEFRDKLLEPAYREWLYKLLGERYPLATVDKDLRGVTPYNLFKWIGTLEPIDQNLFVRIETTADDGPCWLDKNGRTVKKGLVVKQDLLLMEQLFLEINEIASEEPEEFDLTKRKHFRYTALQMMKPKSEVYEIKKFSTKVRNIYACNGPYELAASMIFRPVHAKAPTCLNHPTSWSLIGVSMFHSGMDKIMNKVVQGILQDKQVVFVYADNVYFLAKNGNLISFISADGVKAESSATYEEQVSYCLWVLSHWAGYDSNWKKYMTYIHAQIATEGIALLNNIQFEMGQLSSGTVSTACTNHMNSTKFLYYLTMNGETFPKFLEPERQENVNHHVVEIPEFKLAQQKAGINFEVTASVSDLSFKNAKSGTILDVDILGWSTLVFDILGVSHFLPILQYDRFMKAMVFLKKTPKVKGMGKSANYNMLSENAMKLAKYRSLYLIGGWYYPESVVIQMAAKNVLDSLILNQEVVDDEVLEGYIQTMDLGLDGEFPTIVNYSKMRELPTLFSVFNLLTDTDVAMDFIRHISQELESEFLQKRAFDIAPLSVWREISPELEVEITSESGSRMEPIVDLSKYDLEGMRKRPYFEEENAFQVQSQIDKESQLPRDFFEEYDYGSKPGIAARQFHDLTVAAQNKLMSQMQKRYIAAMEAVLLSNDKELFNDGYRFIQIMVPDKYRVTVSELGAPDTFIQIASAELAIPRVVLRRAVENYKLKPKWKSAETLEDKTIPVYQAGMRNIIGKMLELSDTKSVNLITKTFKDDIEKVVGEIRSKTKAQRLAMNLPSRPQSQIVVPEVVIEREEFEQPSKKKKTTVRSEITKPSSRGKEEEEQIVEFIRPPTEKRAKPMVTPGFTEEVYNVPRQRHARNLKVSKTFTPRGKMTAHKMDSGNVYTVVDNLDKNGKPANYPDYSPTKRGLEAYQKEVLSAMERWDSIWAKLLAGGKITQVMYNEFEKADPVERYTFKFLENVLRSE